MGRVWHKTEISLEEETITIHPNKDFDGLVVEVSDVSETPNKIRLYLNKHEMQIFIKKMQDMMDYVLDN